MTSKAVPLASSGEQKVKKPRDHSTQHEYRKDSLKVESASTWKIYTTIFGGKNFSLMLAFGALQQLIVASSIYFLTVGASEITRGDTKKAVIYFFLYLITLALPYLPGLIAQYYWRLWRASMIRDFHMLVIGLSQPHPPSYTHTQSAESFSAIYANGVQSTLNHTADYTYNFSQCFFNSTFGMLTIAIIVDLWLGIAYGLSVIICAVYMRIFYTKSELSSAAAESRRIELVATAQRFWPNLVLGNLLSLNTWKEKLLRRHEDYLKAVHHETLIRYASSGFLSFATLIPVLIAACYGVLDHREDTAYLARLFVTMPRVFFILSLLGFLMFMIFDFSQTYGRLKVIEQLFNLPHSKGSFDLDRIQIEADGLIKKPNTVSDVIKIFNESHRVTVRGENGSGKTSLLLTAKMVMGNAAFYLPPASDLDLPSKIVQGSTGQRKRAEIEALIKDLSPCVLLLDEWDANLDAENRSVIERLIANAQMRGFRIVEIRHR